MQMSAKTFVDTSIFVHWLDSEHAAKRAAADHWIRLLWTQRSGRTSMQVLNELYGTLARKASTRFKEHEAWDVIDALFAWEPIEVDREIMMEARDVRRRHGISWWDSLIVAAAEAQECAVLLSEDLPPGLTHGCVTVRNPFGTAVQEARVAYRTNVLVARDSVRGGPRAVAPT